MTNLRPTQKLPEYGGTGCSHADWRTL